MFSRVFIPFPAVSRSVIGFQGVFKDFMDFQRFSETSGTFMEFPEGLFSISECGASAMTIC